MACDTFVVWEQREKQPKKEVIRKVLEDYVAGLAEVEWIDDRWIVTLPGQPSWPFQRVGPASQSQRASWRELHVSTPGRWFEVYVGEHNIDVITRTADEVTNNVAQGFAALMARGFDGKLMD